MRCLYSLIHFKRIWHSAAMPTSSRVLTLPFTV
jgi:hypothetical protein